jgi:hypothetical protein
MPLKVRFRHGSAERVLDLPDRDKARPLIIGCAKNVDLRLPFDGVAPKHAALYLKDGDWVIQAVSGAITMGGRALKGREKLHSGDVVVLGTEASAPTLEIEPKDLSAADQALEPARTRAAVPEPLPVAAPANDEAYPPADGEDLIDWASGTSSEARPLYVPRGKRTPVAAIILMIMLGGGVIVGLGVVAYRKSRQPSVVIVRQELAPPPPSEAVPVKVHKPLFELNTDQPSGPPSGSGASSASASRAPAMNASAPPGATSDAKINDAPAKAAASPESEAKAASESANEETPPDPNDVEWAEIRNAHFNVRHQGVALLKYDEYRLDHPGKFTALLDRYTNEAVNWLYWQRIAQLWARQDDLVAKLRQNKRDIQNQPAGEFHDRLVKERADLQAKADQTKLLLTDEMGYHGDLPPDLESPRQLKALANSRDPAKFAAFTKRILQYVRNNHGGAWWDGE